MKKPYAKIEYNNLPLAYDWTIVPLNDINDNIEVFKNDVEDLDEEGFKTWESKNQLPDVKITVVMMTDEEYEKWFIENVESKA